MKNFTFFILAKLLLAVKFARFTEASDDANKVYYYYDRPTTADHDFQEPALSFNEFQDVIASELSDEIKKEVSQGEHYITEEDVSKEIKYIYNDILNHAWSMAEKLIKQNDPLEQGNSRNNAGIEVIDQIPSPFLACTRFRLWNSKERLQQMLQVMQPIDNDYELQYNTKDKSCFIITMIPSIARDVSKHNNEFGLIPLADVTKIAVGTYDYVKNNWKSNGEALILNMVLAPGLVELYKERKSTLVHKILQDVIKMGREGNRRRLRLVLDEDNKNFTKSRALSVLDAFSLTSSLRDDHDNNIRRVQGMSRRTELWHNVIERGIESNNRCEEIFSSMEVLFGDDDPPSYILSYDPKNMDYLYQESPDCIMSLIIGLSTHPQVRYLETERPIESLDYESQCITQSGDKDYRPIFDVGLTGKGQIVSVIDTGLDVDHLYFADENEPLTEKGWNFNRRKVVGYHTFNDDGPIGDDGIGLVSGHGTKVAGALAGKLDDGSDDYAGVAKDAKLHIWDIQEGSKTTRNKVLPHTFIEVMKNGGNDEKGAYIANFSFGSDDPSEYTASDYRWDHALLQNKDVVVFIAAGNTGSQRMNTPAAAMSTVGVGNSQSYGKRIDKDGLGMDYLHYSSTRGPTADDRMGPDIVAPGYKIRVPKWTYDVGENSTIEVYGTSIASPVAAGSAALIRQYFMEGWYPCGWKNCGDQLKPSGSLIKAVMLNGAQPLLGVQVDGQEEPKDSEEYDNNQGFGRINLLKTVPLYGKNKINMVVVNDKGSPEEGKKDEILVRIRNRNYWNGCRENFLSVTMSYYSIGAYGCNSTCLKHNIDLSVERVNKRKGNTIFYPNGRNKADEINNNERVKIRVRNRHKYMIIVETNLIDPTRSTTYSLAMTGCFDVLKVSDKNLLCTAES